MKVLPHATSYYNTPTIFGHEWMSEGTLNPGNGKTNANVLLSTDSPCCSNREFKKIPRLLTNLKSRSTVPLRVSNGITVDLRDPSRHSHIILNMICIKVTKVKKTFTKLYLIPEYETISTDLSVVTLVNHSISIGILSLKLFNATE